GHAGVATGAERRANIGEALLGDDVASPCRLGVLMAERQWDAAAHAVAVELWRTLGPGPELEMMRGWPLAAAELAQGHQAGRGLVAHIGKSWSLHRIAFTSSWVRGR